LKPIGQFTTLQKKALALTRQYLSIFFQTKTMMLPSISDAFIPKKSKRLREKNNVQLLAPYVLDTLLIKEIPKDAIAFMAITAKDLFPKPDWNFVFGLASYSKRVGVTSIYRLQDTNLDTSNFAICLKRLIDISSHEIGHMFTISHCIFAKCVMNGSNSLVETDSSNNRLCSECQKKLCWNIRYNNNKRLKELSDFFLTNGLVKDYEIINNDLNQ
jgi:archaemetzincin